jgi:hypothetical protein
VKELHGVGLFDTKRGARQKLAARSILMSMSQYTIKQRKRPRRENCDKKSESVRWYT